MKLATKLFAIYKDDIHVGNTRSISKFQAIKNYINDSSYPHDVLTDTNFIKRYYAVAAKKNIHFISAPDRR